MGLVGALLGFLGFSLHYAFATAALLPPDEHAHMAYGYAIANGDLPEVDSWDRYPPSATAMAERVATAKDDRYRKVWVANHPPLYYVALAPLLKATEAAGRANAGILAGRLLNIAFAAAGMGVTYLLAVEVSGGVRRIGVVAAALAGFVVQAQYTFSHAYNDGLALLTVTLMLWAAARCVRRADPPGGTLLLGLSIAAAAATRAAGLIVGALVLVAVVVVRTILDRRQAAHPLQLASVQAAVLALPTILLVGWFYVRNVALYGDIGGSAYLLDRFTRTPRADGVLGTALDGEGWRLVYERMVGHTFFVSRPIGLSTTGLALWRWAALVALVGLVVALVWGKVGAHGDDGRPALLSRPAVLILLLAVGANAAVYVQHVAQGGSPWPRYLYPGLGAAATLAALGLNRLAPRILPLVAVAGALATSWALARPTEALLGHPPLVDSLWMIEASLVLAAAGGGIACMVLARDVVQPLLHRHRPQHAGAGDAVVRATVPLTVPVATSG